MENYEQKYKDALERAKTFYENANGMTLKKWIEQVFPELAESEDERIRKGIIKCIKGNMPDNDSRKKYIEWLEQQSEQKPDIDFLDLKTWKYIVDAVLTEKEGIGQYLDNPFTEEVAKKLQKRFGNIEQKPAWSEENELKIEFLIHLIEHNISDSYFVATQLSNSFVTKQEAIDMLKSLRPQSTWKPSGEQMEALHDLNLTGNISYPGQQQILIEFYNDLKKLRKE